MDNLGWTQADKDRFRYDFETVDESVLKRFDDGSLDLDASNALVLGEAGSGSSGKNLRRILGNLQTLTRLKSILPSDLSMNDIRGLLLNSPNKQDVLAELAKFDATNVDELRDLLKKRGLLTVAVKKADVPFNGSPSSLVLDQVGARQTARQAAQDLDVKSPTYDADYKAHMKTMRDASEKSAELMADIHFGKANEIDLSLPNTTAKQGQFDRVYKTMDDQGNTTWHVVECKGGAAELGSRQGHQQCTKPYIGSIIQYLRSTNKLTDLQLDNLDDFEKSLNMNPTNVKSYKLKQPFTDDGTLGSTALTEYNL